MFPGETLVIQNSETVKQYAIKAPQHAGLFVLNYSFGLYLFFLDNPMTESAMVKKIRTKAIKRAQCIKNS